MKLKAIIVEDEPHSLLALEGLIQESNADIQIVATVDTVKKAVKVIQETSPDLVFLSIELSEENGFQLFEYFEITPFETIFTTAFTHYAVKAFRFSPIDYLLKPIQKTSLLQAMERVATKCINKSASNSEITTVVQLGKLALPTNEGYLFIDLAEIICCEAQGNYTEFHLSNQEKILISKTLKVYEDTLSPFNFFRISRSHLINVKHVRKYGNQKNPIISMNSGIELVLSETRKESFMDLIAGI